MSAVLTPAAQGAPVLKVTQLRVVASELTKFRTLRSTAWTLLVSAVLMTGAGALSCAGQHSASGEGFSPVSASLQGAAYAILAFGVLGVLMTSGEYGTGMIRSSLAVVPRRLPVLWGKLAVFAGTVFPASLAASVASFFLGQLILNGHHLGVSITAPGALQSVTGAALFTTVAGLIGVGLGALLRRTAAGISAFAGLFFVIPLLALSLPASAGHHLVRYLPSSAGDAIWDRAQGASLLSPWAGLAVLCGYAAVLIAAAAWRLRRADA